ncbi:MAG: chalcone isomerase family protein [Deferrisomatales bacterium]
MAVRRTVLWLATALVLGAAGAGAATLAGVELPDRVQVEGHTLQLQGAGLRKKFFFKVYVGGLYLTTPTSDGAAAIRADEPKRIVMHFLRDVGGEKIRESFEEGFFKSAQERLDALRPRIDRFLGWFAGEVEQGQQVVLTYLPGAGTRVEVAGAERGVIEGRDFMEALWGIWLGEAPADHALKKGMLGTR